MVEKIRRKGEVLKVEKLQQGVLDLKNKNLKLFTYKNSFSIIIINIRSTVNLI